MPTALFRIWRGEGTEGKFVDYKAEVSEGMVVLDAVHQIQATQANDLACRWNCKAGKCGSCSAEINGTPKLMCMTRLNDLDLNMPVVVEPMRAFPPIRDLVTDVSWNFEVKKRIKPFKPRKPDNADGTWTMFQEDIDRVQEFRKCIECFLCQDVCHVLRDHHLHQEFIGPRFLVHIAALEMHPLDTEDRLPELKEANGIGYCNITKCCTKVCPEHITITDNAIIPLKERVVDRYYDPVKALVRLVKGPPPPPPPRNGWRGPLVADGAPVSSATTATSHQHISRERGPMFHPQAPDRRQPSRRLPPRPTNTGCSTSRGPLKASAYDISRVDAGSPTRVAQSACWRAQPDFPVDAGAVKARVRRSAGFDRCVRARLLRRHHLRTARQGDARSPRTGRPVHRV